MVSTFGTWYFILFVDDYNRFTWLFPLKTKDQALTMFIQFKNLVENQLSTRIKCLQPDNGGEYKAFHSTLVKYGISHKFSCPYTSNQNGRVERKHHHVVEIGPALLAHASMPLKCWLYAFQAT